MDWSKGFSARYIISLVDVNTWTDSQELEFTEGSIDLDTSSSLAGSASVTVTDMISDSETWIRIYLLAHQSGSSARVALFTGLTSSPEKGIDGTRTTWDMDCYSVLKPCDDVLLERGYYAPAGSSAELVKELLSVTPAPVYIDGESPLLLDSIVAEDGETRLSMAIKVLDALGWRLKVYGSGEISVCAPEQESVLTMGTNQNDMIETSVTDTYDWYSCPNVLRAVSESDGTAIARDDDPSSRLSTVSRGREIWTEEKDVILANDENIAAYARRRLKELQIPARTLKYTRRFCANVYPGDIVTLNYPRSGLTGKFRITSQSFDLGYGCRVSEEVTKIEC